MRASAIDWVGGITSGRKTSRSTGGKRSAFETTVYAATKVANEASPSRERLTVTFFIAVKRSSLAADRLHHVLALEHPSRVSFVDDLAAVDGIESVGHPAGVG